MSTTATSQPSIEQSLKSLGSESYTSSRLQHATPEHLYLTTRRCFIGPVPEGWLKSHRRDWYRRHLHIHYSSRSATFSADPRTGKQRRLTGLEGPSASAALSFPQPRNLSEDDDHSNNDDEDDDDDEDVNDYVTEEGRQDQAVTTDSPPVINVPRASSAAARPAPESSVHTAKVADPPDVGSTASINDQSPSKQDDTAPDGSSANATTKTDQEPHSSILETQSPKATANPADPPKVKSYQQESSGSYVTADETGRSRASQKSSSQLGTGGQNSSDNASLKTAPATPRRSHSSALATDDSQGGRDSRASLLAHNQADGTSKNKLESGGSRKKASDPGSLTLGKARAKLGRKDDPAHQELTVANDYAERADTGLVRFDIPGDEPTRQQQMNLRLAQVRKRDTLKRIRRENMIDGQIVKLENMLVRVESTNHEMPKDFDENDSERIESNVLDKWKEYMVVCRESTDSNSPFVLQMYKTRVIAAADKSNKRCVHCINLRKTECQVNLFSSLDKTIVVWLPGKKSGSKLIYILQAKSSASSMEWYTFLRHVLGWARPTVLQVNVPDLETNVRLNNPFAAVESSRDVAQAAQGDDEALMRTMKEEQAIASNIIQRCSEVLSKSHEWSEVLKAWEGSQSVGLAWKRYDRLEWVHGANENKMYGTIGMEKSHELELRPKEHYPTTTLIKDRGHINEPPPVEGFLIRLTSQKGTSKRFGKLFFKRLYFSTHNHYLVFNRPARADPPPPPKLPTQQNANVPSAQQIAEQIPLIYSISPFPVQNGEVEWLAETLSASQQELLHHDHDAFDENQRKINNVLNCDGVISLCNITDIRDVDRGATVGDEAIGQDIAVDFNQDVANTERDDGTTKDFDDTRTFELVLENGLIVRLQAYNAETKKEWMDRLNSLIEYWKARTASDIALLKLVRQRNLVQMNIDEDTEAFIGQYARKWEVQNSFASPELYNMCGIGCCRSINISGLLWRRPRMHGTFRRNLVVLSHGHLIYFRDALRRRDGKLLAHIHHERVGGLDLRECYVYSGLITEKDLLYTNRSFDKRHPGHHALPRMYLEDGWNSTDEDTMTTFVVWHGRRRGWFRSSQAENEAQKNKTKLKHLRQLGAEGRSVIFKTRSRAERDRWVLAIGMEIERLSQGDEVRIVEHDQTA